VANLGRLDLLGQVVQHMGAHEEEIGHEQDAPGALGHAGIDAVLDVRFVHLAERDLDDLEAGHFLHHLCHLAGGVVCLWDAAAVGHQQNCGFHCTSLCDVSGDAGGFGVMSLRMT
jgi:hypothetical protein